MHPMPATWQKSQDERRQQKINSGAGLNFHEVVKLFHLKPLA